MADCPLKEERSGSLGGGVDMSVCWAEFEAGGLGRARRQQQRLRHELGAQQVGHEDCSRALTAEEQVAQPPAAKSRTPSVGEGPR